jgi:hypothetical protein
MPRESQGIQIALIIFVMLSIVLGVTTYLYVQRNGEVLKANIDANKRAQDADTAAKAKENDVTDLKQMIGFAAETSIADVKAGVDEDMKKYVVNPTSESRSYRAVVKAFYDAKNKQAIDFSKTVADLEFFQKEFAVREARGKAQLASIQQGYDGVKVDVEKVVQDYKSQEQAREEMRTGELAAMKRIKDTSNQKSLAFADQIKQYHEHEKSLQGEVHQFADTVRKLSSQTMDVPGGEITWVNQSRRTVWLNRGREDHLERQTKFGVYSGEAGGMSKVKKADVEVVRVVDDHTAEARILEDTISNPIMPGDKIYTPLWSPGQQSHFALAGLMDLDGDGHNQIATVRGLITSNGAVVDCFMDSDGNINGEIKGSTRIVVLGDAPGAKAPKAQKAFTDILTQAEHVSATKMTLTELKEKLGYKKSSAVERFSPANDSSDISKEAAAIKAAPKKKAADKDAAASGDTP